MSYLALYASPINDNGNINGSFNSGQDINNSNSNSNSNSSSSNISSVDAKRQARNKTIKKRPDHVSNMMDTIQEPMTNMSYSGINNDENDLGNFKPPPRPALQYNNRIPSMAGSSINTNAGSSINGNANAGSSMAGSSMAGSSMAGSSMAGSSMAGSSINANANANSSMADKDKESFDNKDDNAINKNIYSKLPNTYSNDYYNQYVPYYNQMSQSDGNKDQLLEKLNYMIKLLEEQQNEKTGHIMEELILYSFLGIFIIFIIDSFARSGKYTR
jgi:hypothetical protein